MQVSTSIAADRISRVLGYQITKGFFQEITANLPQRIVVLAEANIDNPNQDASTPVEITTEAQAGALYGYGSPIHQIFQILRPKFGGGVGSVNTVVYAQESDVGGTPVTLTVTPTGVATANATHTLVVNGRESINGKAYSYSVLVGDTATDIATKMAAAINAVLSCPMDATASGGVMTSMSKWAGVTALKCDITVNTNGTPAGISYVTVSDDFATGEIDISDSLADFGNTWNTIIVNSFADATNLNLLETVNGRPDATTPTGRYTANIFKPFISLFGNVDSTTAAIEAITDTAARQIEATNVLCPAPNSKGMIWEAAANVAALMAPVMLSNPHLDISGQLYPDMPTASSIGDFGTYDGRDFLVKKGSSTVDLKSGAYQIQEIVTTYHPEGEEPAAFRYTRTLDIDWNIKFGLDLIVTTYIQDHAIADDNTTVVVANVIKPKQIKQLVSSYADELAARNLIVDASFMQDSILITTGATNPDRVEIFFKYKRSPYGRVISTTVEAGFPFSLTS